MRITTGTIVGAHGIKGEVKVAPLSDNPDRFRKGSCFYLDDSDKKLHTATVRKDPKGIFILGFKEIKDRTVAEAIKGKKLTAESDSSIPLEDGSYYLYQLEGMAVYDEANVCIGTIRRIIQNGANDVYCVEDDNGNGLMIPGLRQIVQRVDTDGKRMDVILPPGLKEACCYHGN